MIWIPIAIMVISLVGWMITSEIDVLSGLVGIWFCIWLGFVALKPPDPIYSPIILIIAISTCVMYPFVKIGITQREMRNIDVDQLAKAYNSLSLRQDNPIAQFQIANQLYTLGMPGHALKVAEGAIAKMPVASFRTEHQKVKNWKSMRLDPGHLAPLACPDCGTLNQPGEVFCTNCREPFLLNRLRGGIFKRGTARKILAAWGVLVTLCIALPLSTH